MKNLLIPLLTLSMISSLSAMALQTLPQEFQDKNKTAKVTLIEFSTPYCASCKKLRPELESLQKKYGAKLLVHHLNAEQEASQKHVDAFKVDTAPTFFIYNAKNRLLKRVNGDITPSQLRTIITQAEN